MIFPFALKLPCVTWFRAVLPPLLLKVPAVSSSGPGEDPCTLPLQVLLRGQRPPPWSCGCSWGVEAEAIMGDGIHQRRKSGSVIWSLQLRNKPAAFPERPAPLQKLEEERLGCWDLAVFGSACPTVPQPWLVASRLCGTLSQPLRAADPVRNCSLSFAGQLFSLFCSADPSGNSAMMHVSSGELDFWPVREGRVCLWGLILCIFIILVWRAL